MDGFSVPGTALHAAGIAGSVSVDGLRDVRLSTPAAALAAALPGGSAHQAGTRAAAAWAAVLTALTEAMTHQADALSRSAQTYDEADRAVAASLPAVR